MENYIEQKVALAVQYFKNGYNCSQSVFMAFADDFGVDKTMASKISASFGGGIGRMREAHRPRPRRNQRRMRLIPIIMLPW